MHTKNDIVPLTTELEAATTNETVPV